MFKFLKFGIAMGFMVSTAAVAATIKSETAANLTKVLNEKQLLKGKKDMNKSVKTFGAKTKKLKNGLEIVVIEDKGVPRVSVGVLYKVGSCDDPENLMGISHMAEHMFFHGTKKYPKPDKVVGEYGGYTNAMTSEDWTMYVEDCPIEALPKILDMEADRMMHFCQSTDTKFQKERKAVFEERLMCIENQPLGLAEEYIENCLSPQHPYGRQIIGMQHHIMDYSLESVMEHYKKWYRPNNAVLIVVGDVNAKDIFVQAEKAFGTIKSASVPNRQRVQNALIQDFVQQIRYDTDKVETEKVTFVYQAPHFKKDGCKKCFALSIGLDALFDGNVYDFYHYFVEKKSLVSNLDCFYSWRRFDSVPVRIDAALMPGVSYKKFSDVFQDKIRQIVKNGIKPVEFERAKKASLIALTYTAKDGHSKMRMVMTKLSSGMSLDDIENTQNYIESITIDDVNQVLKEVFSKEPSVVRLCPKIEKKNCCCKRN